MEYNKDKIVIFDWGGIVESHKKGENNYFETIVRIIKSLNSDFNNKEEILKLWGRCLYNEENMILSTLNNVEDFSNWYIRLKNTFKLKCDFNTFNKIYQKEFEKVDYYKDVIELEYNTKTKCKIGILSNLIFIDKDRLDKQVALSKYDYVWLSFEIGAVKPNNKVYEIVEKECNIKPKNILFIDDEEKNILTATSRGWNTCNCFGYEIEKIKSAIDNFLN